MRRDSKEPALIAMGVLALAGAFVTSQAIAQNAKVRQVSERQAIPPRAQERLVREVGHELRMLPYYTVFDNLEYRVDGYCVELRGQVTRPTLKSDAEAAVKRIEGVEGVDNRIEVLPLSPNDERLRLAVYQAVYSHPVLTRYALQAVPPLHIIVKNGRVTLVGVVATEMERNVANLQANSVPGIFSVTNKLRVETKRQRT
jgi:hyperosmotically inducible protein